MLKIAILSDIHGNDVALKAVLADIERQGGADSYWVLGDLVAIGHAPLQVLDLLQQLPQRKIIRGNTDRYVYRGDRPGPTFAEVRNDGSLLEQLVEMEGNFSWTQGAVTAGGRLDWLAALPLEFRETLPDGTTVLAVHAAPNSDDGAGIRPVMGEQEIAERLAGCQADLICVGHTHQQFLMTFNHCQILNPGSVSNPMGGEVGAGYAFLSADEIGYKIELRRVDYERQAVIEILEQIKHPARKFIISHLRGERAYH